MKANGNHRSNNNTKANGNRQQQQQHQQHHQHQQQQQQPQQQRQHTMTSTSGLQRDLHSPKSMSTNHGNFASRSLSGNAIGQGMSHLSAQQQHQQMNHNYLGRPPLSPALGPNNDLLLANTVRDINLGPVIQQGDDGWSRTNNNSNDNTLSPSSSPSQRPMSSPSTPMTPMTPITPMLSKSRNNNLVGGGTMMKTPNVTPGK